MTETVSGAVSALRATAEMLDETHRALPTADPGATAFGAGGPGRLGDTGRDLYLLWQRTLDGRAREAAAHAARLEDLADLAARAAGGLHEVNRNAGRNTQQPEVM
jgi:hypothetical protein